MLGIYIGNIFSDIVGHLSDDIYKQLDKRMSFRPPGFEWSPNYNRFIKDGSGKPVRRCWDGYKHQIWKNTKRTYFRTGLISIAKTFFDENKIPYEFFDCREEVFPTLDLSLQPIFTKRDYQQSSIDIACDRQRGILAIATGGGKTVIAAGIMHELKLSPCIFFVTSIDLLLQAKESFEAFLLQNGSPLEVGQIGGGVIDIKDINVMTVQTGVRALGKKWDKNFKFDDEDTDDKTPIEQHRNELIKLMKESKCVLGDEIQHWSNETCQTISKALESARYMLGLSATPFRDKGDDMLIQACFGKKIVEISASKLIRDNWLRKPYIKMIHIRGEKCIYKQWQEIYKDKIVEDEYYNTIMSEISNNYINKGRLVLTLFRQLSHGKTLASKIPDSLLLSGKNTKTVRETGIKKLRNKEISSIVASVIFDEGVDIRPLDTVILAGQSKSKSRAAQRVGRILRPFENKQDPIAIDPVVHQKYLLDWAKEREKMYRSEPEFDVEHIDLEA